MTDRPERDVLEVRRALHRGRRAHPERLPRLVHGDARHDRAEMERRRDVVRNVNLRESLRSCVEVAIGRRRPSPCARPRSSRCRRACSASVTISSVTFCAPASCMRAHRTPGASVVPRPTLAKCAMNRRLVSIRSAMGCVSVWRWLAHYALRSTVLLAHVANAGSRIAVALTHRNFRLLWLGALTSSIGTWMQKVAQAWLIVTMSGIDVGVLSRPRQLSRRAADSALHARRRRRRRSTRSPSHDAVVADDSDGDGVHSRDPGVHRHGSHLARADVVVRHRLRAGVRRPGVSVADSNARRQGSSAQRHRARIRFSSIWRASSARSSPARRWPRSAWWRASGSTAFRSCS